MWLHGNKADEWQLVTSISEAILIKIVVQILYKPVRRAHGLPKGEEGMQRAYTLCTQQCSNVEVKRLLNIVTFYFHSIFTLDHYFVYKLLLPYT